MAAGVEVRSIRWLFAGYQSRRCRNTLPRAVDFHPSVHETLAMYVGFPFLHPLDAKNSDDYRGIPVHLHIASLGDGLRGLIFRRIHAGEKLFLVDHTAVDVHG